MENTETETNLRGIRYVKELIDRAQHGPALVHEASERDQYHVLAIVERILIHQTTELRESAARHFHLVTVEQLQTQPICRRDAHVEFHAQKQTLTAERRICLDMARADHDHIADLALPFHLRRLFAMQRAVLKEFEMFEIERQLGVINELQLKNAGLALHAYDVAFHVAWHTKELHWFLSILAAKVSWLDAELEHLVEYSHLKTGGDERFDTSRENNPSHFDCSMCHLDLYQYTPPTDRRDEYQEKKVEREKLEYVLVGPPECRAPAPVFCPFCYEGFHAQCLSAALDEYIGGRCPECGAWLSARFVEEFVVREVSRQRFFNFDEQGELMFGHVGTSAHLESLSGG